MVCTTYHALEILEIISQTNEGVNNYKQEHTLLSGVAPTTIVCATVAMYPSTCAPKSILTTSPVFSIKFYTKL